MERQEFNRVLDKYLLTQQMSSEDYENLDDHQKWMIQQLKKSFKRLKAKHEPEINI